MTNDYFAIKSSRAPVVDLARALPAVALPRVATAALTRGDDLVAMAVAQEAARRISAEADPADWERDARRIAAEMQWHGGEPGPLFDASRERLVLFSPEGAFLFVGRRILELIHETCESLSGRTLLERFPAVARRMMPDIERATRGGIVKSSGWFALADGSRTHLTCVLVPVWRGGRVVAVLLVGTDTTLTAQGLNDHRPATRV